MAQAPQGPTGAPRQNKTVKEFKGMNTQNRRNAIPEGSFAWLENIQPIGPGHLHSIPGRSESVGRIPPLVPPPAACTDTTERGQQPIVTLDHFLQNTSFLPNTNLRTSWGYVSADEEVFSYVGEASCGGGNMFYDSTCCIANHYQTPAILSHPTLLFQSGVPAINARPGNADEQMYLVPHDDAFTGWKFVYPDLATQVVVSFSSMVGSIAPFIWAKHGTRIYATEQGKIGVWAAHADGGPVEIWLVEPDYEPVMIAASDSFVYVYGFKTSAPSNRKIFKVDATTGVEAAQFDVTGIDIFYFAIATDNLIYLLNIGLTETVIYYLKNFTDVIYVGRCPSLGNTSFGYAGTQWINGSLYYGSAGVSGFSVDIYKIVISCPDSSPPVPVIASITRGSATVAAGANIVVSWADVLIPVANDHIWLLPETTDGKFFIPSDLVVSRITDGLGTSSMNYLIPLATTPGNYFLAYMADDARFVMKTALFAVT